MLMSTQKSGLKWIKPNYNFHMATKKLIRDFYPFQIYMKINHIPSSSPSSFFFIKYTSGVMLIGIVVLHSNMPLILKSTTEQHSP